MADDDDELPVKKLREKLVRAALPPPPLLLLLLLLPHRDTLLIECHGASSSPRDTPLHAHSAVTLPARSADG